MTIGDLLDKAELDEMKLDSVWEQVEHVILLTKENTHES